MIWIRDGSDTHEYVVARTTVSFGSPFQYVVERRQAFRRRLLDLDPERDHEVLHEMPAAGGTDYLAVPLEYGDGSVQGLSPVSDGKGGIGPGAIIFFVEIKSVNPTPIVLRPESRFLPARGL